MSLAGTAAPVKLTVELVVKLAPVIVTRVPAGPVAGEIPVALIVGALVAPMIRLLALTFEEPLVLSIRIGPVTTPPFGTVTVKVLALPPATLVTVPPEFAMPVAVEK
jgi:hypothetical protein